METELSFSTSLATAIQEYVGEIVLRMCEEENVDPAEVQKFALDSALVGVLMGYSPLNIPNDEIRSTVNEVLGCLTIHREGRDETSNSRGD